MARARGDRRRPPAQSASRLALDVVIPAYDAAVSLPRVLAGVHRATGDGDGEVLVVDAGSSDDTASVAARHGARVLRLGHRAGPAEARNRGAAATRGEIILFLDADCVPHADVVERVRRAFVADPRMVSLTGSYDDAPPEPGFFSQYMNLRHHATHQMARREGATFWAGCGAVRRTAFTAAGGFDAERYPSPQIEDIELGLRLAELGPTRLDPDLQVTHLKRWSARSVFLTDVASRALPWSRLLLERGSLPDDLNLRLSQRLAALLALPALAAVAAVPVAALRGPRWLLMAAPAVIALSVALNGGLVRCFARRRGWGFAAAGWLFHQVHLLAAAATYGACRVLSLRPRGRRRGRGSAATPGGRSGPRSGGTPPPPGP